MQDRSVAVVYLARGADPDPFTRFRAFADAYRTWGAGLGHRLYVVFKGFADPAERHAAQALFTGLADGAIDTDDASFDIGAYRDALGSIGEDVVCFLNTNAEVASPDWLAKLVRNLDNPGVGMVSATGSYESLHYINRTFPTFPNPHLRSNAFALRRTRAVELLTAYRIASKLDTFEIESGPDGLTRRIFSAGETCLIVGGDGRGYGPDWWPVSDTFRQGAQTNLLVHDNLTRAYMRMGAPERQVVAARAWGATRPCPVVEPLGA